MFSIGDFSKLSRVPVSALRYYDEVGLLKPSQVDASSGYRYYAASQLPRLNRILALKDLGFSLEQIARVLNEGLGPEELRGMFRLRQAELHDHIMQEQERLTRVQVRLRQIEQEDRMPDYDIVVKQVEPQLVASIRRTIANYQAIGQLFDELMGYLARYNAFGLTAALWHDNEYKASDVDGEAVCFIKNRVPETEQVKVYELPGTTVASLVYKGAYNSLSTAYEVLVKWIEANGYKICGDNRELYLHATQPITQDNESYVTEIQFEVTK